MSELDQVITKEMVRAQGWKYYFLAIAFPVYVIFLPLVFAGNKLIFAVFLFFPGLYLYTWAACMMHECWHRYVPNINNDFFYDLYSYMLILDPYIYRVVHGHHHSKINTWEDVEFHPLGEIKNVKYRRIYNLLEIVFGVIFTFGIQMHVVPRHPLYKDKCNRS